MGHGFNYKRNERAVNVYITDHLNDSRGASTFVRSQFFNDKLYSLMIESAFKHGLSSFNDKGLVVVSFHDTYGYQHAVLLRLIDLKQIIVISSFMSRKPEHKYKPFFVKVHNRINLWNYFTLPKMEMKERDEKKAEIRTKRIEAVSQKEDHIFKEFASNSSIRKLK